MLASVLSFILWLAVLVLMARFVYDIVRSFVPDWRPGTLLSALGNVVYSLTDPPLRAIRKVLPPLRIGGVGLDFGIVVLFLAIGLLQRLVMAFL